MKRSPPSQSADEEARKRAAPARSRAQVRIIGGQWRRSLLPVADRPGLRPTPDRVRETLFNWLGQDLSGLHCLDAFAGSGALGFEAASRHAARSLLVENDRQLAAQLQAHTTRLGASNAQVRCGDGLSALAERPAWAPAGWDVIFIDPPYAAQLERAALAAAQRSLAASGLVYLESPRQWHEQELAELGWRRQRYLAAGQVHAHLLQAVATRSNGATDKYTQRAKSPAEC